MSDAHGQAEFTFTWRALRLLGRGLYSNPWSALSELVANGLDANADNVYVYVDARNRSDAVVEVFDDGTGMSRADINTYVRVGYDKRAQALLDGEAESSRYKGRKGIGKLAALFLSKHFYLQTRHSLEGSAWELDARDDSVLDSDYPRLLEATDPPTTENDDLWEGFSTGTRLTLLGVDLTGYGPQSIAALGTRLANQFLLPTGGPPHILLAVRTSGDEALPNFEPVKKSIAFGNFVEVVQNFPDPASQPLEIAVEPSPVRLRAVGLPDNVKLVTPSYHPFPVIGLDDEAMNQLDAAIDEASKTFDGVTYELTGWIGVHASINKDIARQNDERFVKNKYYNPAQIRVYVRGKLASDRLLSQLGITGTYANYVEGEISFDILDDDSLPDIATSNRQDFDETDGRITLLRALVRPIVQRLILNRNGLASDIAQEVAVEKSRKADLGKQQFTEQLQADFANYPDIPAEVSADLQAVIANKIEGEITAKSAYRVFISHANKDKAFASLIDDVLRARGATKDEIFYTSRTGEIRPQLTDASLGEVIRSNLVDTNTLIFYLTSKNFLDSEFCLFEGGAGWATRAVSAYLKLNVDFGSIPKFLTNGKAEATLLGSNGLIVLRPDIHNYLIAGVLNPMIEHLNRGRRITGVDEITPFLIPEFPSAAELSKLGAVESDYFDADLVEHWGALVDPTVAAYLIEYNKPRAKYAGAGKGSRKKKGKKR